VRLTVIGCSGSFPGPGVACSSYLLTHAGFSLLLDLGNGALGELQRYLDPRDVDALFLSHLHADHWLDVMPLAHVRRHHPDGRTPPAMPVVVPRGERSRIAGAAGRPATELSDVFELRDPGETELGPFHIEVLRTRHPVEAYAARVSASGKTLVYTADTGPFAELAAFARGADVLLAEAGFAGEDNPPDLHLTAPQAGELGGDAGAGLLVVTHVAPWHDAGRQLALASAAFDGPTVLARPGLALEI
jgi:ribonuclease BN (tRNA processing enzyme)